jgi:hypothetical protein
MASMDLEDWAILLRQILRQTIEDYVKLQHPTWRNKKYLHEAWLDSVDMFFDSEYRFAEIKNSEGECMNLKEFLKSITGVTRYSISELQNFVIQEAAKYWKTKESLMFFLPEQLQVEGNVYSLLHSDAAGYNIDYDKKEISLNKRDQLLAQKLLLSICFELTCYHNDIALSKDKRNQLGDGLFRLLQINDGFKEQIRT